MFEEQYTDLWNFTDECAERIRALGGYGPNSFKEMLQCASLQEAGQTPDALGMVQKLADDNRAIVDVMYPVLRTAEEGGDEATVDLLVDRVQTHEKTAWMLESFAREG
jgi:starvation-inducible DNA-binding protein